MAAISNVSSASYAATTGAMPTHAALDLIIMFAYRDGNTTAPVLQAGWNDWPGTPTGSGNTQSARLAYKWAASSSETTGTWALATGIVIMVYRNVVAFGGVAWGTGTGATITYPALASFTITDGTSWGVRFAGQRNATNLTTNAPSTVPNTARTGVATEARGLDSNGGISSITAGTQSTNGSTGWEAVTIELVAPAAALVGTLTDDFTTGSTPDPAKWSDFGFGIGSDASTLAGGKLIQDTATSLAWLQSAGYFDLTGSSVKVQLTDNSASTQASLALYDYQTVNRANWVIDGTDASGLHTHVNGDWYRIRESGGTIFYDYSSDGVNWTNGTTTAMDPMLRRMSVNLQAIPDVGPPTTTRWDNLNVDAVLLKSGMMFASMF